MAILHPADLLAGWGMPLITVFLELYGQESNRRHIERSYTKSETMVRLATG